jgi:hypothetical protein
MLSGMLDAAGGGIGARRSGLVMGPEALAIARKIGPRVRIGLLPMHAGIHLGPVAQQLAAAFLILGDSVHILDIREQRKDDPRTPAMLERSVSDASARARRVIVVLGESSLEDATTSLVLGLDGVVLVARPAGATEWRLHQLQKALDADRCVGVLMVP